MISEKCSTEIIFSNVYKMKSKTEENRQILDKNKQTQSAYMNKIHRNTEEKYSLFKDCLKICKQDFL